APLDSRTVLGVRIGPDPAIVRAIHRARQQALPEQARAADPSALANVVDRSRRRDDIARARNEFRTGGTNG
uniref:hypothetical protein n=1 Tax=Salmonella enterica TaxID=28901 RepID=UPI003298DB0B